MSFDVGSQRGVDSTELPWDSTHGTPVERSRHRNTRGRAEVRRVR